MSTIFSNGKTAKAVLFVVAGLAASTVCRAQGIEANVVVVRPGQSGNLVAVPVQPTTSAYALTGQQSRFEQAGQAWQQQTGPVFQFGNGRLFSAPAR